jgi:glycosyltransferase involved in cell wall biosynthesis
VLFMGALTFGKGVHTLVAAMAELLGERPRAHLLLVGSGTYREVLEAIAFAIDTGDLELLEALCVRGRGLDRNGTPEPLDDVLAWARTDAGRRALVAAQGRLAARVTFVGRLDHERLRFLLPLARVAAFPSVIKEASPLVFAEALSAGVLPAGADHSGFRAGLDALVDLLPPALVDVMRLPTSTADRVCGTATHLATLLDHARDTTLPARLRTIAVDHFDWSHIAARLESVARAALVP